MKANKKRLRRTRRLILESLEGRDLLTGFAVTSVADAGAGSLRAAIQQANTNPGADTITFNIPGNGTQVIALQTPLPAVTDSVTVDGYTQPGATPNTLAEGWNGQLKIMLTPAVSMGAYGLHLQSSNNVIRGLRFDGFNTNTDYPNNEDVQIFDTGMGLFLDGSSGNTVEGNIIRNNQESGIFVLHGSNNQIGGATPQARNLIYENMEHGIVVFGNGSHDNKIQGNFIGTKDGAKANPNGFAGIRLMKATHDNLIGGTAAGEGNVISGNAHWGIQFSGEPALGEIAVPTKNVVRGNLIGTTANGAKALPNQEAGVFLRGSSGNTIGGEVAGARNIISGNTLDGVIVSGGYDTVAGNYIGLNRSGNAAIPNKHAGVHVLNSNGGAQIGGSTSGARNIISGNTIGVYGDVGSSQVQVVGNFIGTDPTGELFQGNAQAGILLAAPGLMIGGEGAGLGNVISGNSGPGVKSIAGGSATLKGNFIGTNAAGTKAVPNQVAGVLLDGGTAYISGASLLINQTDKITAPNVIAGNYGPGVWIKSNSGSTLYGNYIGIRRVDGDPNPIVLPNQGAGVLIDNAPDNKLTANTIAGNTMHGVLIQGVTATNNQLRSNFIGFNKVGNSGDGVRLVDAPGNHIGELNQPEAGKYFGNHILSNHGNGISVNGAASVNNLIVSNSVGDGLAGITDYGNLKAGILVSTGASLNTFDSNLVLGNKQDGVLISGATSTGNAFTNNSIGQVSNAANGLGNTGHGVHIVGAPGNIIGVSGDSNVIANNSGYGVAIEGATATSNKIQANQIGFTYYHTNTGNKLGGVYISGATDTRLGGFQQGNAIAGNNGPGVLIKGVTTNNNWVQGNDIGVLQDSLGNQGDGIVIDSGSGNTIGGASVAMGNNVRFNRNGIVIQGAKAQQNQVLNNRVGTDTGFIQRQSNTGAGIFINAASNNQIGGGSEDTANTVVANGLSGIEITGSTAKNNTIQSNFIGTTPNGAANFGNNGAGLRIDSASSNTVHRNHIVNNGGAGVVITKNSAVGNSLRFNEIDNNGGLGIDLGADGVTLNDATDSDQGPNSKQNFPILSSATIVADGLQIAGTLTSLPKHTFDVDFYASSLIDPSGYGEGKTYVGTQRVTTNAQGVATISVKFPGVSTTGRLTATATLVSPGAPSTSEFSPQLVIQSAASGAVAALRASNAAQYFTALGASTSRVSETTPLADPMGAGPAPSQWASANPALSDSPLMRKAADTNSMCPSELTLDSRASDAIMSEFGV